ncbi:MAG TPA: serine hydrolase, partial [Gemmatimonadales bacterium]
QLLWTPQLMKNGTRSEYGIGWFVGKDKQGRTRVSHSGGSVGGTAFLVIYPEQHVIVALLCNSDAPFVGMAPGIAERFVK